MTASTTANHLVVVDPHDAQQTLQILDAITQRVTRAEDCNEAFLSHPNCLPVPVRVPSIVWLPWTQSVDLGRQTPRRGGQMTVTRRPRQRVGARSRKTNRGSSTNSPLRAGKRSTLDKGPLSAALLEPLAEASPGKTCLWPTSRAVSSTAAETPLQKGNPSSPQVPGRRALCLTGKSTHAEGFSACRHPWWSRWSR